jgi:F0F1-type ATP synthase membrane subunit a
MLAESGNKIVEVLTEELKIQELVPIHLGPLNLSITNAVVYMWVSAIIVFLFFFIAAKRSKREPERLQTWAEIAVNFATGHLTGQLGEKGKKYPTLS